MYFHNRVLFVFLNSHALLMMMCLPPASAQKSNGPRVSPCVTPHIYACHSYNLRALFKVVNVTHKVLLLYTCQCIMQIMNAIFGFSVRHSKLSMWRMKCSAYTVCQCIMQIVNAMFWFSVPQIYFTASYTQNRRFLLCNRMQNKPLEI